MTVARIQCLDCVHFRGRALCAAFPEGIPIDIIQGAIHETPRGDEVDGITYEPVEGAADYVARVAIRDAAQLEAEDTLSRLEDLAR